MDVGLRQFIEVAKSFGVNHDRSRGQKTGAFIPSAQNPDVMLAWSKMEDQFREWMKETPECITFTTLV